MQTPSVSLDELLQRGYRYAVSLTHDPARAEDLLHDAWLAILQAGGPRAVGYLFSSIRSRFINQTRHERLVPMVQWDEALEQGLLDSTGAGENAADGRLRVSQGALERALSQLRPIEREALYLATVEGYTAAEIADLTRQSRGTVLSLVHRARAKLRRFLEQAQVGSQP